MKITVKEVQMHNFLVCPYKSSYFAKSQENCEPSHDCETVTFGNSEQDYFPFLMK